MSAFAYADDCHSAQDVMARAATIRARRQLSFKAAPLAAKIPARPAATDLPKPMSFSGGAHFPVIWNDFVPEKNIITIKQIKVATCRAFQVSMFDIDSVRRDSSIVTARHVAIALANRLTILSLPAIGRHFGNRDHTTVMHAARKMKPLMDLVDPMMPDDASAEMWVLAMQEVAEAAHA